MRVRLTADTLAQVKAISCESKRESSVGLFVYVNAFIYLCNLFYYLFKSFCPYY